MLIGWVEADGDITMPELAARLLAERGVSAHPASLSRLLIQHGFTVKKTLLASEADRADVVRARHVWQNHRQPWMKKRPERLVFVDESGTTTKMTRLRGRARCGQRLKMKAPFGHWGTQTFVAGLRHDGLTAPWVINGPMNRRIFETYVETQLAPTLKPGDMVILDNLSSHKSEKAKAILKARGPGSSSCHRTAPTSIRSRWPLPSSRRTCEKPRPEPSTPCGKLSAQSAIYTHQKNARTTLRTPGMLQINGTTL